MTLRLACLCPWFRMTDEQRLIFSSLDRTFSKFAEHVRRVQRILGSLIGNRPITQKFLAITKVIIRGQPFSGFQTFWSSTGPYSWDQCKSDEKILWPPHPPGPSTHPWWSQKPQNTWFYSRFFRIFWGRTPRPPSYKVVTFMHVALLALILVLVTTLCAFQAFWSSARQTPAHNINTFKFIFKDHFHHQQHISCIMGE